LQDLEREIYSWRSTDGEAKTAIALENEARISGQYPDRHDFGVRQTKYINRKSRPSAIAIHVLWWCERTAHMDCSCYTESPTGMDAPRKKPATFQCRLGHRD
jgi:hypothetical protein